MIFQRLLIFLALLGLGLAIPVPQSDNLQPSHPVDLSSREPFSVSALLNPQDDAKDAKDGAQTSGVGFSGVLDALKTSSRTRRDVTTPLNLTFTSTESIHGRRNTIGERYLKSRFCIPVPHIHKCSRSIQARDESSSRMARRESWHQQFRRMFSRVYRLISITYIIQTTYEDTSPYGTPVRGSLGRLGKLGGVSSATGQVKGGQQPCDDAANTGKE